MSIVQKTVSVPLSELKPYPANPRKGNVDLIADSLATHGQYRAIVVNQRTGEILAGNHTFLALQKLGAAEALVHYVDVDADQAAKIVLVDNRSNDLAGYNDEALLQLLQTLPDLDGTGYGSDDLERLLGLFAQEGDAPSIALPNQWQVVVECVNEHQQTELLDRLEEEGYTCRALIG